MKDAKLKFDVRDGHGIKILQRYGIKVAVLTGAIESSWYRAKDLEIDDVYQGAFNKKSFWNILEKHKLSASAVAFLGDDIVDIPVLKSVGFFRSGGWRHWCGEKVGWLYYRA